jgi:hypothetical protein
MVALMMKDWFSIFWSDVLVLGVVLFALILLVVSCAHAHADIECRCVTGKESIACACCDGREVDIEVLRK